MASVEGGGYGRVYGIKPVKAEDFMRRIRVEFSTGRAVLHGNADKTVTRVASFCGAGLDDAAIAFATAERADAVVSSDVPHHRILALVERGIAVAELTHYSAEAYGFNKIYQNVKSSLQIPSSIFSDGRFA